MDDISVSSYAYWKGVDKKFYILKKKRNRRKNGNDYDVVIYSSEWYSSQVSLISVMFAMASERGGRYDLDISSTGLDSGHNRTYVYQLKKARLDWSNRVEEGWERLSISSISNQEKFPMIKYRLYSKELKR